MGRTLVATAVAAVTLAAPQPASAARVDFQSHRDVKSDSSFEVATFLAEPGERNDLSITSDGDVYTFTDAAVPVAADSGCEQVTASSVRCRVDRVEATLGDANDRVRAVRVFEVRAGAGDDDVEAGGTLDGGEGNDVLRGGPGNDGFFLGPGRDEAHGGAGDDSFSDAGAVGVEVETLPEPDVVHGGPGRDRMGYSHRLPTRVDLPLDRGGARDEGDVLESVEGGSATGRGSTVVGDAGRNYLNVFGTAVGAAGDDVLWGSSGLRDRLDAGSGDDEIHVLEPYYFDLPEFPRNDWIRCGPGRDKVFRLSATTILPADCEVASYFASGGPVIALPGRRAPRGPLLRAHHGFCESVDSADACRADMVVHLVRRVRATRVPLRGAEIARGSGRFAAGSGRMEARLNRAGRAALARTGCVLATVRVTQLGEADFTGFMFRFGPRCPLPAPLEP